MRIGIFGGTFDPPHEGHRKFAEEFIDRLKLDRLLVIPTFIPPHKEHDDTADSADRFNMVKLMFDENEKVTVSDLELRREGKSYTCDTVRELSEIYPDDELIFLLGSDMLLSFHTWRQPEEIIRYVKICAVTRSGDIGEKTLKAYVDEHFPTYKNRFIICSFIPLEISSTEIRQNVKCGKKIDGMVSEQILKYIREKELYL
jgi:nicotinate-nucleotide adenylyltransferase